MSAPLVLKVLVLGSEDYTDSKKINATLQKVVSGRGVMRVHVITGGRVGAEMLAATQSQIIGIHTSICPPLWTQLKKKAPHARNLHIIRVHQPHALLIFGEVDEATQDAIDLAKKSGAKILRFK